MQVYDENQSNARSFYFRVGHVGSAHLVQEQVERAVVGIHCSSPDRCQNLSILKNVTYCCALLYILIVLVVHCCICKVSMLCTAVYARCPCCAVLYIHIVLTVVLYIHIVLIHLLCMQVVLVVHCCICNESHWVEEGAVSQYFLEASGTLLQVCTAANVTRTDHVTARGLLTARVSSLVTRPHV